MIGRQPTIFLSSTFYDLRQIRADLFQFLRNDLGYSALASEHPSFPIDPDADAVANCRKVVEEDADCLLLIIGGRYGSVIAGQNKSVTNLEYLTARAKGIPIFAFVHRDILAVIPVWESNPSADFSKTVDTTALFEFVKTVRTADGVWTFPFDTAQDIIGTLRIQFAYLQCRALEWQKRLRGRPRELRGISGPTFQIALEQPDGWQGQLFAHALMDEIDAARDLRLAYDTGIAFGLGETVPKEFASEWMQAKISELLRLTSGLTSLMNHSLSTAMRANDIEIILYAARQMGQGYRHAIEWTNQLRRAYLDAAFQPLVAEMGHTTKNILEEMEEFGPKIIREVNRALSDAHNGPVTVHLTFTIDIHNTDQLNLELDCLRRNLSKKK